MANHRLHQCPRHGQRRNLAGRGILGSRRWEPRDYRQWRFQRSVQRRFRRNPQHKLLLGVSHMNAGLQVFNDDQILQIDSDYRNPRFAFGGYCNTKAVASNSYFVDIAMDATTSVATECPMVIIRPESADQYVGGCFVNSPYPPFGSNPGRSNGGVQLWGQCPFDWAVLSTRVAIGSGGSPYGLDIFDAGGNLVFASAYRQLRITQTFDDLDSQGWPRTFSLTKGQTNPWIWANPMIGATLGETDEQVPGIVGRLNAARNQLTIAAVDVLTMQPLLAGSNPFPGVRRLFGTATY